MRILHSHLPEATSEVARRIAFVRWNSFRVPAVFEHLFSISSHSFYLRVNELERRIVRPVKLVNLEVVCVERYLMMAVDAGAGLGYNLATC